MSTYARLEREQRWLLASLPAGLSSPFAVYDRYLNGTRFRLRRVERDGDVVFKLGQKIPCATDAVMLTNTYLSADEYGVFAALPAREVRKARSHLSHDGRTFAIDHFDDGLILAEVELTADEPHLPLPPFASRDVTGDPAFTGGALAR